MEREEDGKKRDHDEKMKKLPPRLTHTVNDRGSEGVRSL
jgi:hypothetical protein